jgi:MFS family permease
MVALGSLAGPSLGGILVHIFGWPSIFIINVPIGVVGCILAFTIIPEMFERQKDKTYDYKGTGLFALFVLVLFLGLLLVQQGILPVLLVIPTIIVAAFVMWILIMVEKRSTNPIINLQLFGIHEFSFGLSAAFFSFIAINSTLLFMPFYLQNLMGYSALKAGLIISAYPVTLAIIAPISGWLSDKITYRPLTIAGMAVTVVSLILLATINRTTPIPVMILYMILLGGGIGIFQSPNNSSIMGSVPRAQLGVAGGLNALFRNLGMVSGTTFSVLIFSFVTKLSINSVTYGVFNKASFVKGLSGVFIFDAVCCFLAVAISLFRAASIKPGSEKAAREAKINGARPL